VGHPFQLQPAAPRAQRRGQRRLRQHRLRPRLAGKRRRGVGHHRDGLRTPRPRPLHPAAPARALPGRRGRPRQQRGAREHRRADPSQTTAHASTSVPGGWGKRRGALPGTAAPVCPTRPLRTRVRPRAGRAATTSTLPPHPRAASTPERRDHTGAATTPHPRTAPARTRDLGSARARPARRVAGGPDGDRTVLPPPAPDTPTRARGPPGPHPLQPWPPRPYPIPWPSGGWTQVDRAYQVITGSSDRNAASASLDRADAAAAARGDTRAFERIYARHVARSHSLARRMIGPEDADDATQEVFVRAWTRIASFRGDAAFGTWLHRLAINVL